MGIKTPLQGGLSLPEIQEGSKTSGKYRLQYLGCEASAVGAKGLAYAASQFLRSIAAALETSAAVSRRLTGWTT